eukprot:9545927-Prorocentrum_lima.AAC.1
MTSSLVGSEMCIRDRHPSRGYSIVKMSTKHSKTSNRQWTLFSTHDVVMSLCVVHIRSSGPQTTAP